MRNFLIVTALAGAATLAATPALAAQGCGPRFHRAFSGRCVPNRVGVIRAPVVLRIGGFYPGRGYWDGRRYWAGRYRYHGGWRYR